MDKDKIRYLEGKVKCEKLTKKSSTGVAIYETLEDGEFYRKTPIEGTVKLKKGDLVIAPVRRCFKERK